MAFLILGKASQLRGGDAGRKWGCAREFNSGEGMLAGGGCMVRRPNSGEAVVVGGDDLFE